VDSEVTSKVDYERRRLIAPNHSMTHILNAALRNVLGDAVDQRGSLCNEEKLRFDFSHNKAMTLKQLKAVEAYCQETIQQGQTVASTVMPLEDAKKIEGVRAVFGEVYPDPVRVIQIGDDTSVEFCGGTHLENTAEAEAFCLVEETAVAKGIRRITAVTRDSAKQALAEGERFETLIKEAEGQADGTQAGSLRKDLDAAFVSAPLKAELRGRIEAIQKKAGEAQKKVMQKRVDQCLVEIKKDIQEAKDAKKQILVLNVDIGADAKASQLVMNTVREIAPDMAFLGLSEEEPGSGGKIMAFACVPDALVDSAAFKADEWIRATLESCGGRGGGKPGNAQGQAQDCDDVDTVVAAAIEFGESKATFAQ
jgi:alanyl-tRNA synthetase